MMTIEFVIGLIALATICISCMAIVQVQSTAINRPPWYYFIALWGLALTSGFVFGESFTNRALTGLPTSLYVIVSVVAAEHALVFLNYQSKAVPRTMPTATALRINVILGLVVVLVMIGGFLLSIYGSVQENGEKISRLQLQKPAAGVLTDTALVRQLQRDNLALRMEIKQSRAENKQLRDLQIQQNAQMAEFRQLLKQLTKATTRIGVNQERSRISDLDNAPRPIRPQPPRFNLPTVKPPTTNPDKPYRRPGKNQTTADAGEFYEIDYQN